MASQRTSSMKLNAVPCSANAYHWRHTELLLNSYQQFFGQSLIPHWHSATSRARAVYEFQYPVLSHTGASDPKFNYANLQSQKLFEADWATLIGSSSSGSAANEQALHERQRALAEVLRIGGVKNYQGRRVTLQGNYFQVENASLWNLFDWQGCFYGQAVVIFQYRFI